MIGPSSCHLALGYREPEALNPRRKGKKLAWLTHGEYIYKYIYIHIYIYIYIYRDYSPYFPTSPNQEVRPVFSHVPALPA